MLSFPGCEGGWVAAVWGGLSLGPRASRPHRVRTTKPSRSSVPTPSRQDAGAPGVPGSRLAAFQIAKIGNSLG